MSEQSVRRLYPQVGTAGVRMNRLLDDLRAVASGQSEVRTVSDESWCGASLIDFFCTEARQEGFVVARAWLDQEHRLFGSKARCKALYVKLMRSVATRAGEWGCFRLVLDQLAAVYPERRFGTGGASLTGLRDYRYSDVVRAYCLAARSNADKKRQLCLDWVGGGTLARDECKFLGVRAMLDCTYVVDRLLDFARVVRLAGFPGVVMVLEGTESIQQMRADVRESNQYALVNMWNRLHSREEYGCLVVLAGTDDSIRNRSTGLHATVELRHLLVDSRDVFDPGPWAR